MPDLVGPGEGSPRRVDEQWPPGMSRADFMSICAVGTKIPSP
jgi:hypothetical protein